MDKIYHSPSKMRVRRSRTRTRGRSKSRKSRSSKTLNGFVVDHPLSRREIEAWVMALEPYEVTDIERLQKMIKFHVRIPEKKLRQVEFRMWGHNVYNARLSKLSDRDPRWNVRTF